MVRLLEDRVLVRRVAEPVKLGSIYTPPSAVNRQREGIVVAVGPGKVDEDEDFVPTSVKVGDRVILTPHHRENLTLDGTDYILLREAELLGVLEAE